MKITIDIVNHKSQRYPTCGDWQWVNASHLQITVSELGNWRNEVLIGVHEAIEALLCKERGIDEQVVTEFDQEFELTRLEDDTSEPGDHPLAPYRNEHFFATSIERLFAHELGVYWDEHETLINNL